jgi:hypothetical protein
MALAKCWRDQLLNDGKSEATTLAGHRMKRLLLALLLISPVSFADLGDIYL